MISMGVIKVDMESKERIIKLRKQLLQNPALKCSDCGTNIHETITGKYDTDFGPLCKHCFAKRLGEEVENNPVGPAPLEKASH